MSHYTVLVIGEDVEKALAPFDENIEVHYIRTKEEHIEKEKENIERYKNGIYAEYLSDPKKYEEECGSHQGHFNYISKEFPKKLEWNDEEVYKEAVKYYEKDQINEDGSTNETYNPQSKWDWYQIGGRWSGMIKLKENAISGVSGEKSWANENEVIPSNMVDSALAEDIDWEHESMKDFGTFAVLVNGNWYERGQMGWWGMVSDEKDEDKWDEEFEKLLKEAEPDTRITVVDCHI